MLHPRAFTDTATGTEPVLSLMQSTGLRRTRATVALAALFKNHPHEALSHADVESALQRAGVEVNRVTVYRLLDRFAAAGLLHRQVDGDRVSRFAMAGRDGVWSPRFECEDCHRHFRLDEGTPALQAAARAVLSALESRGHEGHGVEIAVRGRCAGCAHPAAMSA